MTNKKNKPLRRKVNCLNGSSSECVCMTEEEIEECEKQIEKK